jgi:hypothetical protein
MNLWRRFLEQSVIGLSGAGFAMYPLCSPRFAQHEVNVDLDDDNSVHRRFRGIVEWEYGPAAFRGDAF